MLKAKTLQLESDAENWLAGITSTGPVATGFPASPLPAPGPNPYR